MTTWNGDTTVEHTMQDEYEYARERGWVRWTTDEEGQLIEDGVCMYESKEPGTLLCLKPEGHDGAHDTPRYATTKEVQA